MTAAALAAERAVLGAILLKPTTLLAVADTLDSSSFHRGAHRSIFEAAQAVHARGDLPDVVQVADELDRRDQLEGAGGAVYLSDLLAEVPFTAAAVSYARIVVRHADRRRLVDLARKLAQVAAASDTTDEEVRVLGDVLAGALDQVCT